MSQADFERAKNDFEQVLREVLQDRSGDALSNFAQNLSQYELTVEEMEQLKDKFQMDLQEIGVDVAAIPSEVEASESPPLFWRQDSDADIVYHTSPSAPQVVGEIPPPTPQVVGEIPPHKNDRDDEDDEFVIYHIIPSVIPSASPTEPKVAGPPKVVGEIPPHENDRDDEQDGSE